MPADAAEIVRLAGRLTSGAWAAWMKAKLAIDSENQPAGKHKRRAYRLNDVGVQLQQHLRARAAQHDHEVG